MNADAREKTYEVNSEMLAESERMREKAEEQAAHDRAELSTVIAARDRAIDDRNEWRHGYERETNRAVEAEAKVAAWIKCVAQSSTQYREMVKALDEAKELLEWTEDDDWWCEPGFKERRDAFLAERSTP